MLEIGMVLSKRYEIIQKIGSGGMSFVYKAKDQKLGRLVAIKVLKDEFAIDETFVKKFEVEARSAAMLSHGNIVSVYDVGTEGRCHYIVMEYLEGVTLKEYIREKGVLNETEILKISVCIASALEHAHNNKIIHRDIKPQNIILTANGKVKVTDFGIARVVSDNTIDINEAASGSVYYIAPEQARGGFQDNKSDFYSLGIIMYEMATGQLPYTGDSTVSVALMQIHDPMPLPSSVHPEVSKNLETIIMKATQKKTALRYQSAEELIEDLKLAMQNPDDVLVYTQDEANDHTVIMTGNEMKHIWNRQEVKEYGTKKDPLDKIVTVFGIVFALAIVLIALLVVFNTLTKKMIPTEIAVPNVTNLTVSEAVSLIEASKLGFNVVRKEFHDEVEAGKIISQTPADGAMVLENQIIELVESKGQELFAVAGVVNKNYEEARLILEEAGFYVNVLSEYNELVEVGSVIRQEPAANAKVALKSEITLYVSKGAEEIVVKVPNLKNLLLAEAENVLKSMNLVLGNVTELHDEVIEEGKIISMSATPDAEVKEGYIIDVAVSLGPEPVVEEVVEPTPVSKSFTINNILDYDQETCELLVILNSLYDNTSTEVIRKNVTAADFPMVIDVSSIGEGIIAVYNNEVQQYEFQVQFTDDVPVTTSDSEE
ncbi:MAG: Stk1 family PASTA domain-containing Ser/Thr kinase [Vallitaleaceae bacterium]|nr:Stk1 family PASTA domain-containing Ser/Thr kinase [Vallitaleaceae bacterium]